MRDDEYEDEPMVTMGEAVRQVEAREQEALFLNKDDEPAHADAALRQIADKRWPGADTYVKPVFALGFLWAYDGRKGVWEVVDKDEIKRNIIDMREYVWWVSASGTPRKSAFTAGKVDSIYKMICMEAGDNSFFEVREQAMAFSNGKTLVFKEPRAKAFDHDPEFRCRSYYDFPFEAKAGCPNWLSFLDDVFRDDDDKNEKVQALMEFIGAALRGESTHFEKVLLLLGEGRNGKSIFCDVVGKLFEDSMCAVPPQDMSNERYLVALESARLNMVSDIPVRGFRDSGGFKQVVSGDRVAARRLYSEMYTFAPKAGHIFSANDLPKSPDTSQGFYRRWMIIRFNRYFTKEESRPRKELLDELVGELPGIAIWALTGIGKLREDMKRKVRSGFMEPSSSGMMVEEWSADNNQVQQFCVEAVTNVEDGKAWTTVQELFSAYKDWARDNNHSQMAATTFRSRMKKLHYNTRTDKHGVREYNVRLRDRRLWANGRSTGEDGVTDDCNN